MFQLQFRKGSMNISLLLDDIQKRAEDRRELILVVLSMFTRNRKYITFLIWIGDNKISLTRQLPRALA